MLIKTRIPLTFRHAFTAREGKVIISCDFASQELRTAAYLSKDPTLLKAFTDPSILTRVVNGEEIDYVNPYTDLHTQTARGMYPQVFEGTPEWDWIEIASSTVLDGMPIRKASKIVNFG